MRLAEFLATESEAIMSEAVAFARTLPVLSERSEEVLRNHTPAILAAIGRDLATAETVQDAVTRSHGKAHAPAARTAAQTHGRYRAQLGADVEQVVAEYRALRASVLRLWARAASPDAHALDDMTRFNEAIDQAVAESLSFYVAERDRVRTLFLGALTHDLRGPLNAIGLTTEVIRRGDASDAKARTETLSRAVARMASLLDCLLEITRLEWRPDAVQRKRVDLAAVCAEEVHLRRATHPGAAIEYVANEPVWIDIDASQIRRALGNLISNAVKHGDPGEPVLAMISTDTDAARIVVENAGNLGIENVAELFEPMKRSRPGSELDDGAHLGLGLFIVRQIAKAHGGDVTMTSNQRRVRFSLMLPRTP